MIAKPIYGSSLTTAVKVGDNLYTHAAYPGLLLTRITSAGDIRHLGGVMFETTDPSDIPPHKAAGYRSVFGFAGRDISHFLSPTLDAGMKIEFPLTASDSEYIELGVSSISEFSPKAGDPPAVCRVRYSRYMWPKAQRATDVMSYRGDNTVMGVVTDAEFGCFAQSAMHISNIFVASNTPKTTLVNNYPHALTGYLGRNISLGRITDVLAKLKDSVFDVDSDIAAERDQAIRDLQALGLKDELLVPVGVGFKMGGGVEFGLLTFRSEVPNPPNGSYGHIHEVKDEYIPNVGVSNMIEKATAYGCGPGFYVMPSDACPSPTLCLRVIPLAYSDAFADIRTKMLMAEALPASGRLSDPLHRCAPWEGGVSLSEAVKQMLVPYDDISRKQALAKVRFAAGNVPGNVAPEYDSDQNYGHMAVLMRNGRFAGTVGKLAEQTRWVLDRIKQLVE